MSDEVKAISIQVDDDIISVVIGQALANVVGDEVVLQVPVFASGRAGHIYFSPEELRSLVEGPVMNEAIHWGVNRKDG